MRAYVALVTESCPDFFDAGSSAEEEDDEDGKEALPAGVIESLEASGFTRAAASGGAKAEGGGVDSSAADVFTAARGEGGHLGSFLPGEVAAADEEGMTPLHHAVDAEQPEAVAALLAANADPNALDRQGCTPLHLAALLGAEGVATALLRAGADVSILDEDGKTAAQMARGEGHAALAEALRAP